MKHLVVTVSADSSLHLLRLYADVILLDKDNLPDVMPSYDSLYIRSHFSRPALLPQVFRAETETLVNHAKHKNPNITFIDKMSKIDSILTFEDKWHQYQLFHGLMPRTELFNDTRSASHFNHPVFKRRLSSRGVGVTWDMSKVTATASDWITQESLSIEEELRVYIIRGNIQTTGAVRQSKTPTQGTRAISSRTLLQDEIELSLAVSKLAPDLDIAGIDIARTTDNKLMLIEVNRSPGFSAFAQLSGINLAAELYNYER